ncbi:MAG: apolipoprotein N-acyltransferase, partial [Bacteroidota bacterium]
VDVVVVQPNIDPYKEKFSGLTERQQLDRILALSDSVIQLDTQGKPDFVVAPETALPSGMWEEEMSDHPQTNRIWKYLSDKKSTSVVIGAATNALYPDSGHRSITARKFLDADLYYDSFNTALNYGCDSTIQKHHKSKLVPGVEKMPFPAVFSHLEGLAIDLGGMTGSLGVQDFPSLFTGCDGLKIAPVICYESIYGDFLSYSIRQGAGLIFIITNAGWWDDTPGYRQHQAYARLRAIEFRRSVARSANTGISCFIDQLGDVHQATSWWVPTAIRQKINYNSELTFYARYGDFLGTLSLLGAVISLGWMVLKRWPWRRN